MSLCIQWVKTRDKGIKEHSTFLEYLFMYPFGFWKYITFLFTQIHKIKPTRMGWMKNLKWNTNRNRSLTTFQTNNLSTPKKNKLRQIPFEHNTLLL